MGKKGKRGRKKGEKGRMEKGSGRGREIEECYNFEEPSCLLK